MTDEQIRTALRSENLPDDMTISRSPPPMSDGAFSPESDTLAVQATPRLFTVFHEGAHCEHYAILGMRGKLLPADLPLIVGVLLAGEVYVGRRLAAVAGYEGSERAAVAKAGGLSFNDFVEKFVTSADFEGRYYDGSLRSIMGIKWLMRFAPLLGIETTKQNLTTFAGMQPQGSFPGVMVNTAIDLEAMARADKLADVPALTKLGADVVTRSKGVGVAVTAA